jgi:hypothetical protein
MVNETLWLSIKKKLLNYFLILLEKLKLDYVTILMNLKVETQSGSTSKYSKKNTNRRKPKMSFDFE